MVPYTHAKQGKAPPGNLSFAQPVRLAIHRKRFSVSSEVISAILGKTIRKPQHLNLYLSVLSFKGRTSSTYRNADHVFLCDTNTRDIPATVMSPTRRERQEKYLARETCKLILGPKSLIVGIYTQWQLQLFMLTWTCDSASLHPWLPLSATTYEYDSQCHWIMTRNRSVI